MDRPAHSRIFISYSHDSPEHRQRVRRLADRLIRDGVDCEIDLDEPNPPEGWWAWMDRKLAEADFVLVVCTEGYYQKATARRQASGHGAKFESVLMVQALYDSGAWNERFIPVLFEDLPSSKILAPLRPYSRYRLDGYADYTDLLRYITHQPKRIRPPLGRVPELPPDGSPADAITAIALPEPPEIDAMSGEVPAFPQRIVRHCPEKDPEERVHSAHEPAFEPEVLAGQPAASAPRPARRWPPSPRHRMLLGLAIGLVGAGILAGFLGGRAGRAANPAPVFQRITCRRGQLDAARFTPDGNVVYSAAWDGQPRAVFRQIAGAPDSLALSLPTASLLAVSRTGELAVALDCRANHTGTCAGTLATVAMSGAAPREIQEQVQQADWAADGQAFALVHDDGSRARLEFPAGKVLYETDGHISFPRVSPSGDRIAFLDHPSRDADDGSVAMVNLAGKKTTLVADVGAAQGLAWAPSGQEVWFTAARNGPDRALYAVSLSGKDRSIATAPGNLTLQDIAADGRVLLATDTSRVSIHALAPGETRERELSWLDWSVLGDLSDDGSTILFDEEGQLIGPNFVICLRKTDGSPLVRLGEGHADALSPDGKWVLSKRPEKGAPYVLLPTRAGAPREISSHGLQLVTFRRAAWFPDGRRIAFVAAAPGHAPRVWVQDLAGAEPKPVTPEGFGFWHVRPISPDGRYLFAGSPDSGTMIFPVDGGAPRAVPGIAPPRTVAIRWSADGRHLFVRNAEMPIRISLLDLETGRMTPWRDIAPTDLAGAMPPFAVWLSADGKSYAYNLQRNLSDLYLVEGLR